MKKRLLVALLVLAMVPAALFAGFFDFGIGATAQFVPSFNPYETAEFDWAQLANIENYGFGADIRTRIMFAELDIAGLYSQETVDSTTYHGISGLITGGISLDLLGLVRVGLGMGPRVYALIDDQGNASIYGDNGELTATTDFEDAFMNAPMTYRATVDLKLGNLMVGVNYTVDSDGFTFANMDTTKLAPQFDYGKLGASVTFILF